MCQGLRCLYHGHHPLFSPPARPAQRFLFGFQLPLSHTQTHTHPLFSSSPPFELIWPQGDQQRRVCVGGGRDVVSLSEGDNAAATARSVSPATFHSLFVPSFINCRRLTLAGRHRMLEAPASTKICTFSTNPDCRGWQVVICHFCPFNVEKTLSHFIPSHHVHRRLSCHLIRHAVALVRWQGHCDCQCEELIKNSFFFPFILFCLLLSGATGRYRGQLGRVGGLGIDSETADAQTANWASKHAAGK